MFVREKNNKCSGDILYTEKKHICPLTKDYEENWRIWGCNNEIWKFIKFVQAILLHSEIEIQKKYSFTIESKISSKSTDEMNHHLRKSSALVENLSCGPSSHIKCAG